MVKTYDVIVYEISTMKVTSIVGSRMMLEGKYNSAETRLETMYSRMNEHFNAKIVESGKYKVGDIVEKE